jgi:hypothetical protein
LSYLAGDAELVSRFLALTGIEPGQLRNAAAEPGFLAGVLDHYLGDERLLVAFATDTGVAATDIAAARRALAQDQAEFP